eukprot:gene21707-28091_t
MGNGDSSESKAYKGGILQEYERNSHKKLLAAIKGNSYESTLQAIEYCRLEFVKPTQKASNKAEYDDLILGMIKYLSFPIDVGEGLIFKKTPIEFAEKLKSYESKRALEEKLEYYRKAEMKLDKKLDKLTSIVIPNKDEITEERKELAKARLQAFRDKKT